MGGTDQIFGLVSLLVFLEGVNVDFADNPHVVLKEREELTSDQRDAMAASLA